MHTCVNHLLFGSHFEGVDALLILVNKVVDVSGHVESSSLGDIVSTSNFMLHWFVRPWDEVQIALTIKLACSNRFEF